VFLKRFGQIVRRPFARATPAAAEPRNALRVGNRMDRVPIREKTAITPPVPTCEPARVDGPRAELARIDADQGFCIADQVVGQTPMERLRRGIDGNRLRQWRDEFPIPNQPGTPGSGAGERADLPPAARAARAAAMGLEPPMTIVAAWREVTAHSGRMLDGRRRSTRRE
jgi:hypothetical protein